MLEDRRAQAFPVLAADDIDRLRRFATLQHHADGTRLYETGRPSPGVFLVLAGAIRVTGRDGHGHNLPVVDHGPGQFSGEIGQLSGRRSFVDGVAVGEVEALLLDPAQLHAALIAEAALGEKIMRALILRRVALLETGAGGPVLIGGMAAPGVLRLRNFLQRNSIPHLLLDPADDADARAFVERYAPGPQELPLAVCPDGSVLRNPTEEQLARCIGMLDTAGADGLHDVVVVGAGPAGLAAAVYGASEGLSVLVIDERAFGGQAGASARIENYFGFPTGISGQALVARAFTQAQKFGAKMLIPATISGLDCGPASRGEPFTLRLADGRDAHGRAVVIASGARYRRPGLAALLAREGAGVWYWASPIEAKMCAGQEIALVGGGNSAGQAAVYLSATAAKVWMLVRGPGLAQSMSQYLVERIAATPNIELCTQTEIVGVTGPDSGIEALTWRQRETGREDTRPVRQVFLFLGADPCTDWLRSCGVALDDKGFVHTGASAESLGTSVPGVYAIGDARAGSVKRVGAAIGEGAAVVAQLHARLARPGLGTPAM